MELAELLALRVPAGALGLDEARYQAVLTMAVTRAESAAASVNDAEKKAQAVEAHTLAFLFQMEAERWRRALSGSGPDGSVSVTEISTRMGAAEKARDAQMALFETIVPPVVVVTPAGATRASGSVRITFEG